jgi:hypothetical protein
MITCVDQQSLHHARVMYRKGGLIRKIHTAVAGRQHALELQHSLSLTSFYCHTLYTFASRPFAYDCDYQAATHA